MSWNIKTPGDYINGPLTVVGDAKFNSNIGAGGNSVCRIYAQKDGVGGANSNTTGAAFGACHAQASQNDLSFAVRCTGSTWAGIGAQAYATQLIANSANANAFEIFTIGNIPLIFGTAGAEKARLNDGGVFVLAGGTKTANGAGIGFPVAQQASTDANTLDDYEEGIFTPTVGGTWTANPSSMTGTYTKVGRLVTIQILFNGLATKASATSGWIDGLPFNVVSTGTGAVCDSNVANVGLCFAANSTRVWLTANSFSAGANYLSLTYTV